MTVFFLPAPVMFSRLLLIYSFKILIVFLIEKWRALSDDLLWGKIQ